MCSRTTLNKHAEQIPVRVTYIGTIFTPHVLVKTVFPFETMKHINILILTLFCWTAFSWVSYAQNTANITLTASKQAPVTVTLVLEDVHFHPNLGTGLADAKLDAVASVNFAGKTSEKTVIQLTEPKNDAITIQRQRRQQNLDAVPANPATT